jgi:ubiquinol oxidase
MEPIKPSVSTSVVNYGYKTRPIQLVHDKIPKSLVTFIVENVRKEVQQKRYGFRNDPYTDGEGKIIPKNSMEASQIRKHRNNIRRLELNNENIWTREHNRPSVQAPRSLMAVYYGICFMLDVIYDKRPIDRFWFLETVARMPYFSYVATLHMYETLGFWEIDGELKRIHLDEEINESQHLRVMESLGGNTLWWNRFLARHGAIAYYVILLLLYIFNPRIAYLSSELLEMHAVDTYTEFYESNREILSSMPLTPAAHGYAPSAENMYDVFVKIAEDEWFHAETMKTIRNLDS